eukprot:SAG22_NODE_1961_length_3243_cov_15.725827_1_plen_148_part_10
MSERSGDLVVVENQYSQRGQVRRSNSLNEVSAESGARSVIWLVQRTNLVSEVSTSAESGAMSVIWLCWRYNSVSVVSDLSGAMSVIWLFPRPNVVSVVSDGDNLFVSVDALQHPVRLTGLAFPRGLPRLVHRVQNVAVQFVIRISHTV